MIHISRWSCFLLCLLWLVGQGCVSNAPVNVETVPSESLEPSGQDSGEVPEPPQERVLEAVKEQATCQLKELPASWHLTEGGRILLSTQTEPPDQKVEVLAPSDAWLVLPQADKQRILIRAPYGDLGEKKLTVKIFCPDGPKETQVSVHLAALSWRKYAWTSGTQGPTEREHPRIWMDAKDPDILWLWGGLLFRPKQFTPADDLWKLHLETGVWTQVTPQGTSPQTTTAQVVASPELSVTYVYSGDASGVSSSKLFTLSLDSTQPVWKELAQDTWGQNAGTLGSLVYDPVHQRLVTACGIKQGLGYDIHCRVALYNLQGEEGKRWQEFKSDQPAPAGRYGFAFAYDAETKGMILFSGAQQPQASNPVNAATDTWRLELGSSTPSWKKLSTQGETAPGRRNGCWALDPVGHRFFVFGGTADQRTALDGLYVLHLDEGAERWHRVETSSPPPKRASCIGIYDAKRQQVLFGFGNSEQGIYADFYGLQLAAPSLP